METQKASYWRMHDGERRALLLAGDFVVGLIALAIGLVVWAANAQWYGFTMAFLRDLVAGWFYLLPLAWLLLMINLYDVHKAANWRRTMQGVAVAALIGFVAYSIVYIVSEPASLPRRGVAGFLISASLLTLGWRWIYIRVFTAPQFMRRVLLVGVGNAGQMILRVFNSQQTPPFHLVGIIDDDPQKQGQTIEGHPVLTNSEGLLEIVSAEQISDVIVAISGSMQGSTFQALLDAQEQGVEITRMPVAYEELCHRVPIEILETDWLLRSFADDTRVSGFYELGKRVLDILGGIVGSLLLLVMLPFVGVASLLDDGWPIFYLQTRLGKAGRPYKIIKFRTMIKDAEADGTPRWATEDDERATRVGRILRKTRLDEWPQFINVLRGEMSLVGPRSERPQLVEHFQRHVPFYRARLLVKPGITGWAQINYDYAATIEETMIKLEYDLYYIKHRSLWLDLNTLMRTPGTMFGMRGQ
ncbi:MAG TPA: sugar transferase [Chloroflexi bacterium]|nr:sugar transferase [Chloroflexota bacterium]